MSNQIVVNGLETKEDKDKDEKSSNNTGTLDEAMMLTGFGKYNIKNMLLSGIILMGMIMETLGLSYVMPAAQCDLELSQQQKGWLGAIPFVAIILTSHMWGWLADTKGRKPIMLISMTISVILSALSSFSPNLIVFAVLRFLACVFVSGPSGVAYAYLGEFNSLRHRDRMVAFGAAFVGIGTVALPCVSWIILPMEFSLPISFLGINYRPWRLLVVACAIPYAIAAACMLRAEESPKYLNAVGRPEECLEVVKKIYSRNKNCPEDNFPIKSLVIESSGNQSKGGKGGMAVLKSMKDQTLPLFQSPLLLWTCLSCFVQFGIFATVNGFYIWFPSILNALANADASSEGLSICDVLTSGNKTDVAKTICDDSVNTQTFQRAILVGLVFCSMYLIVGILVDFVGKKAIIVFVLGVAGACGVASNLVLNQMVAVSLFAVFQMSGACIGLMTAVVVDLYPTRLRAMAVCLSLMMGRVGSVLGSNLIGVLLEKNCGVSFYFFGGLLVACALLCFTLPGKKSMKVSRVPVGHEASEPA